MAHFIISEAALKHNAAILHDIAKRSGAKMLIALKAFSSTAALNRIKNYADGCCASGLYEARLGRDSVGGDIAVYSPAYRPEEMNELISFANHIDFNSIGQWRRYQDQLLASPRAQSGALRAGLRINPCHSTAHTALYDPCIPGSRLGIPKDQISDTDWQGISGLHFHTLCEQGFDDLLSTWQAFEQQYQQQLISPEISYINLGGGHWISKPDYDRDALVELLISIREKYQIELYMEPGEAWAIHSGILRAEVLDIFDSLGYRHAILDVSASAHMPDVLEMPYRPDIFILSSQPSEQQPAVRIEGESYSLAADAKALPHSYRLGAPTCLAGDIIGDYSFAKELHIGDSIIFDDMSHYTIVKTSHFNGVPHPDIMLQNEDQSIECIKKFGYEDFLNRLG